MKAVSMCIKKSTLLIKELAEGKVFEALERLQQTRILSGRFGPWG